MASEDTSEHPIEDIKTHMPSIGNDNYRLDDATSTLGGRIAQAEPAVEENFEAEAINELKTSNALLKQELADIKASLTEIKFALSSSNATPPDGSDTWMIVDTGALEQGPSPS